MSPDIRRYNQFGWDYEYLNPLDQREVDWYGEYAACLGGPVLELACGSGRLLVELARRGFNVTGIDLSRTMLRIAKARKSALPPAMAQLIELVHGDITTFDFGRCFRLAIIADNSIREFEYPEEYEALLCRTRINLDPNGILLVTVRRVDLRRFSARSMESPLSQAIRNEITGELVRRQVVINLSKDLHWLNGQIKYEVEHPHGRTERFEFPFRSPVLNIREYTELFTRVGFSAKAYVGYEHRFDDEQDPVICFVCSPIVKTQCR